jgi:hypothetical protein
MLFTKNLKSEFQYSATTKKQFKSSIIIFLLLGLFFLGFTYFLNNQFTAYEQEKYVEIPRLYFNMYKVGGKKLVAVFHIFTAACCFYASFFSYKKYKQSPTFK